MTTKHLSEEEMQQYSIDASSCGEEIAGHMQSCASCQAGVEAYRQLFIVIHEQPAPVFSFNLPDLVLQQLPKAKPGFSLNNFFILLIIFTVISLIGVPLYLFRKYFSAIFNGALSMTMYLIIITSIVFLIFQSMEMYRKYQKQISLLN